MDKHTLTTSTPTGKMANLDGLMPTYQDMAYNVAYRILGHADRATSATQEALLAAHRALPAFRGGSLKVWLLRIVTHACYRQLSPGRRRLCFLPQRAGSTAGGRSPLLTGQDSGPEAPALLPDITRSLEAGLAGLPVTERVTLVLADVQGCSYAEIAQITGVSPGAVSERLNRARIRLRDYLTGCRSIY